MTQFYSRNDVPYSGDVYSIPFSFIKKEEIKVYIDDELWDKWHFLNDSQLTLDEVPENINYSNIISVRRITNIEEKVVEYTNNSLLTKENLNKSQDQLLHAVQEIYDNNIQFEIDTNNLIEDNKQEILDIQNDFKNEVYQIVEDVSSAADKINQLETAVNTAVNAANTATDAVQEIEIMSSEFEQDSQSLLTHFTTYSNEIIDTITNQAKVIEEEFEEEKQEIEDLANYIKDNAQEIANRTSFAMFDTVLKDHILTYEESKGLALQGTYVYKEAVAGSRYGYADFYNKCLEEYQNSTNVKQGLKSNVTKVGSLIDDNGVLSGFNSTSWAVLPNNFSPATNNWTIRVKFKTGTIGTVQYIINSSSLAYQPIDIAIDTTGVLTFNAYENNTTTKIVRLEGTTVLNANTDYWGQLEYNNITGYTLKLSTDGKNFTTEATSSVTTIINQPYNFALGADFGDNGAYYDSAFTGSIDLTESYINIDGQRWWTGANTATKNPNGHIFYDIAQKDVVDEIFNSTGMAWFYGVDTENERVFLPRNNWFVQMTGDGLEVGKSVEAGLPNITGQFGHANTTTGVNAKGAISVTSTTGVGHSFTQTTSNNTQFYGLDASLSNPIYGNSDTVQSNAVKKLLYICVGNMESMRTATDVVEVTTTENDTLPLGYHFYQKNAQPSVSYLKSEGQWNAGKTHKTFYNEFVNKIGEPFASGKVVEVTETYTDYDLVINQDDMTFRLPLLDGSEDLLGDEITIMPLVADGETNDNTFIAPCNGTYNFKGSPDNNAGSWYFNLTVTRNGQLIFEDYKNMTTTYETTSIECDVLKGDVVRFWTNMGARFVSTHNFIKAKGNGSLYFKVANAVQNLELLDAGEVLEAVADMGGQFTTKANIDLSNCTRPYIIESYVDGTSGYNLYSNGYCEQWGRRTSTAATQTVTITLLKPYKDSQYNISGSDTCHQTAGDKSCKWAVNTLTATSFKLEFEFVGHSGQVVFWRTCGYVW